MVDVIKFEYLKSGQQRSYQDSIYEVELRSTKNFDFVKRFCTKFLIPCEIEGGGSFNGACSFPHGLNPYYSFKQLDDDPDGLRVYSYKVCKPYTG